VLVKRICVLTGASGMLGSAFIERYRAQFEIAAIHHHHELSCASQNQRFVDPLEPSAALKKNEHPVFAIRADLSTEQSTEFVCSTVLERFHGVDLLVNAAAYRHWNQLLAPYALADAEQTMNINVLAPIRLAVGFARLYWCFHPKENVKFRRNVINVSSTAGLYVYPDLGQALYATSKAALNQATYHLASELWDIGIRVNVVAPNSFPDIVPVESVLDQIAAFDNSEETGRISVLHT